MTQEQQKAQQPQSDGIERRSTFGEVRAIEPESRTVVGYAAVFNRESDDLGGFVEVIRPGAFRNVLKNADVRALFNHNPDHVLARTPDTLKLYEDETGLRYEFEAPNTTAGNDLLESLRRRDVRESSFAFRVKSDGQKWSKRSDGTNLRELIEVDFLPDVSPVTYPAYPNTTVAKRSLQDWQNQETPPPTFDDGYFIRKRTLVARLESL